MPKIFFINFCTGYVFTVRNIFDWLADRSQKIYVEAFSSKRNSEDSRRKSRVSFNLGRY